VFEITFGPPYYKTKQTHKFQVKINFGCKHVKINDNFISSKSGTKHTLCGCGCYFVMVDFTFGIWSTIMIVVDKTFALITTLGFVRI
jgi:hypothetical protein